MTVKRLGVLILLTSASSDIGRGTHDAAGSRADDGVLDQRIVHMMCRLTASCPGNSCCAMLLLTSTDCA